MVYNWRFKTLELSNKNGFHQQQEQIWISLQNFCPNRLCINHIFGVLNQDWPRSDVEIWFHYFVCDFNSKGKEINHYKQINSVQKIIIVLPFFDTIYFFVSFFNINVIDLSHYKKFSS